MRDLRYKFGEIGLGQAFGSIRVRLTLWYVAILAVVLVVFGAVIYNSQARSLRAELDDRLRAEGLRLILAFDARDGQIHLADVKPGSKSLLPENEIALVLDKGGSITSQLGQVGKSGALQVLKTYSIML